MRTYCFHFYLPIIHSAGPGRAPHNHTLELAVQLKRLSDDFVGFRQLEQNMADHIKQYANVYLNDMEAFRNGANIEDIGDLLFQELYELLQAENAILERLEIGETPLRVYAVGIDESDNTVRGVG